MLWCNYRLSRKNSIVGRQQCHGRMKPENGPFGLKGSYQPLRGTVIVTGELLNRSSTPMIMITFLPYLSYKPSKEMYRSCVSNKVPQVLKSWLSARRCFSITAPAKSIPIPDSNPIIQQSFQLDCLPVQKMLLQALRQWSSSRIFVAQRLTRYPNNVDLWRRKRSTAW